MGCCSGLFKSKKNKKKTKHNNNSQFAAPRPVQHVVQNGKVSYQPAGATSQYNGGGGGGYYQPAPYNTQPTGPGYRPTTAGSAGGGAYAYQQQGEYQHDPEYLAKLAVNQSIAGTVGSLAKSRMGPNGEKYGKYIDKGANLAATQITRQQFKEPKAKAQQPEMQEEQY